MNEIASRVFLAGEGVGRDRRGLAEAHLADVGFVDVGAQPDVIEVGERHHRRAGQHDFAEFGLPHQDDAVERRGERRVAEHDLGQIEFASAVAMAAPASATLRSATASSALSRSSAARACLSAVSATRALRRAGALGHQRLGAVEFELREVTSAWSLTMVRGCGDVLLGDVELAASARRAPPGRSRPAACSRRRRPWRAASRP